MRLADVEQVLGASTVQRVRQMRHYKAISYCVCRAHGCNRIDMPAQRDELIKQMHAWFALSRVIIGIEDSE